MTALFACVLDEGGRLVKDSITVAGFPYVLGKLTSASDAATPVDDCATFCETLAEGKDFEETVAVTGAQLHAFAKRILVAADWQPVEVAEQNVQFRVKISAAKVYARGQVFEPDTNFCGSFIGEDLKSVSQSLDKNEWAPALRAYMGDVNPDAHQRIDVVQDSSVARKHLAPKKMPLACWPASGKHHLVYGQQLAVNLIQHQLSKADGLYAVNGPPGTGKTTLLRDVVASVIAQRAAQMCAFDRPKEAFSSVRRGKVYGLNEALRGFEMVVTSPGNAAVKNVTAELPRLGAIDPSWLTSANYFREVADVVVRNADAADDESSPREPDRGEASWGLISAVLGNAKNRKRFVEGFWNDSVVKGTERQVDGFRTLLEMPEQSDAKIAADWKKVRARFAEATAVVERMQHHLANVERLLEDMPSLHQASEAAAQVMALREDALTSDALIMDQRKRAA